MDRRATATTDARHLLIGSSLPVFVPGGIHDLQRWNERVCDGAWGRLGIRLGERVRRALDLEDWPAFGRSFDALVALLAEPRQRRAAVPTGDDLGVVGRHPLQLPLGAALPGCHPCRHAGSTKWSTLRSATRCGRSSARRCGSRRRGWARSIARALRRATGGRRPQVSWDLDHGPVFANCVGILTFDGEAATVCLERATADDDGTEHLEVVFEVDLAAP